MGTLLTLAYVALDDIDLNTRALAVTAIGGDSVVHVRGLSGAFRTTRPSVGLG